MHVTEPTHPAAPIPPLRAGVVVEHGDQGGALFDPLFGRRIRLDARGLALARALSAPASADGVDGPPTLAALAERLGEDPEALTALARRLMGLDLLDTPRARARATEREQLAAVKRAPAEHLRPIPEAHFACTMCGSCCGGHVIGPVTRDILAGLGPHLPALADEIRRERRVESDLFFVLPGQRATPDQDVVCHSASGSCVFLDERGLCRIHAKVGGDKKPLPCRIFPWELVATPTGIRVAVQRECRDFLAATADTMPPVAAARDEVLRLIAQLPALPTARPTPTLRGAELPTWADYEALEAKLLAILDGLATTSAPTSIAAFEALAAALPAPQGPAPTTAAPTLEAWRDRLIAPLRQILGLVPASDDEVVVRVDALALLERTLSELFGWPLSRALAPLDAIEQRLFSAHLRHTLWSTTHLRASSVEAGLARVHAEWVLARLMALTRAREVKRFHVTAQDLQDGLANACFLFRHRDLAPVLDELDPLTTALFLDAPQALAEAAARLLDARTELPKF